MSQHYIAFRDVTKSYGSGNAQINARAGVEQQRVAITRALTKNPRLLLCDEPQV